MRVALLLLGSCLALQLTVLATRADEKPSLPLVFEDDFEKGADRWEPSDKAAWKVKEVAGGKVFSQFGKKSSFKPPHRSPLNFALIKDVTVGDFTLDVKALSTEKDYGHRDLCLFFGYQDKGHLYYAHLGKETDDHANQIFIVDGSDRKKISDETTKGTPWDDKWHHLRIVRRVGDGTIEVYYDDMQKPAMRAKNTKFTWGRVGVGTFDDTGDWDDIKLYGTKVEPPKK